MSDLHGNLPGLPPADLYLLAGDYCPYAMDDPDEQEWWMLREFRPWLESLGQSVVGVVGNHDRVFQEDPRVARTLPSTYLRDQAVSLHGLRIYGSPWQPTFFHWAFNLDEPELERKWQDIPEGIDILLLHGPPLGYGDEGGLDGATGSPSLLVRIDEVRPKLVLFGHIHRGYGCWQRGTTTLANVSLLDAMYRPSNQPQVFDIRAE